MDNVKQTAQWYDENADEYTRHVRDPSDSIWHSYYEKPAMYDLLPKDMSGLRVLSLGCGSGEDCHEMAKRRAEVVGIDISKKLVEKAREAYPECEYQIMNMEDIDFEDTSFDLVYSSLAVHYLDDWTKMIREVTRVLKPKGLFQFSMGHPVSTAMEEFDFCKEFMGKGIVRIKTNGRQVFYGDYLANRQIRVSGTNMAGVTCFHKTIQTVCDIASEFGLVIDQIVEPLPLPELQKVSPEVFEKLSRVPDFIIYKLRKR